MLRSLNLRLIAIAVTAGIFMSAVVACTKKSSESAGGGEVAAQLTPAEKGKKIYMANCIACHNVNPKQDGGIGPANWGSSLELLQAKVIENKYPEGYTPKRPSKAMAPLPHLKDNIADLHAYLNAAE